MQITAVPETITREQFLGMIRSLGIDPTQLQSMTWSFNGIEAVVYALNDEGHRYAIRDAGGPRGATHKITIRVVDEDES